MQNPENELIAILKEHGVNFTASLPCEKIKTLLELVENTFHHVNLTREEEGVGICSGAALTGRRPAMFIQSSGIGNMINALLSLTQFYEQPLALFVSRRGVYKEKIEAQLPMGQRLPSMLTGAGITSTAINKPDELSLINKELPLVYENNRVHAFLLSPAVWEGSNCEVSEKQFGVRSSECENIIEKQPVVPKPTYTRYDIIKLLAPRLEGKVVVSNLGWPSKELYAVKHQPSNFYMLGSMGMVTPIGLGIALTSSKEVVVIDGDGSLLMNPGTLATAAAYSPQNLTIVAIDNNAYGSTGNQPTLTGQCVDLEQVARGFGFKNTRRVSTAGELDSAMKHRGQGPAFIHVLAIPGNKDVPNIPIHHLEIKKQVQEFLQK